MHDEIKDALETVAKIEMEINDLKGIGYKIIEECF